MKMMKMMKMMLRGRERIDDEDEEERTRKKKKREGWREAEEDAGTAEMHTYCGVSGRNSIMLLMRCVGIVIWRQSQNVGMRRGALRCFASRAFLASCGREGPLTFSPPAGPRT
jgi:hypothetical protein